MGIGDRGDAIKLAPKNVVEEQKQELGHAQILLHNLVEKNVVELPRKQQVVTHAIVQVCCMRIYSHYIT